MLEIVNLVGNSRKRIILLENSYLVRIHRIFGKVKVSTFTIERRMQEYWKDERGLRSTYAFYQLFPRVSSTEVLKLLKWKNCSINQSGTNFLHQQQDLLDVPWKILYFSDSSLNNGKEEYWKLGQLNSKSVLSSKQM